MQQIVVQSDDYNSESQVTKDEWLQVLLDGDFMSLNYKFFLIVFLISNHSCTKNENFNQKQKTLKSNHGYHFI